MIESVHNIVQRGLLAALFCMASFATSAAAPGVSEDTASLITNRRVLWLGDSITQDGKYVSFVEYYLNKLFPGQNYDFISIGLASETVSGLSEKVHPFPRPCVFERLQRALDLTKPATVIACYGMNDGIYHPQSAERTKSFQDGIHRLIGAVHSSQAQLILLTPTPFEPLPVAAKLRPLDAPDFSYSAPYTNYDNVLSDYAKWEMSLPVTEARIVVNLHAALDGYSTAQRLTNSRFSFTRDGIHPSPAGHLLMALTFLNAMGVKIDAADIEAELARVNADPLFQLIRERREKRSVGWLNYVGYTRDKTVKTDSIERTEATAAELKAKVDEKEEIAKELDRDTLMNAIISNVINKLVSKLNPNTRNETQTIS